MLKVTILIPAYNEENTILEILGKVKAERHESIEFEVIVIDDGSKDKTLSLLKNNPDLYTKLIQTPKNGGKGAAVQIGMRAATGDYVLFQDADLEYDPSDYGRLFLPILRFNADVVIGSRFMAPSYTRVAYFWHKLGNRLITLIFNVLNNTTYTDIYTCYLMYRRNLIDPESLRTFGWDQQAEILTKISAGRKVYTKFRFRTMGGVTKKAKKFAGTISSVSSKQF